MQITSNENSNTKYVQIYLTEEELKRQDTKEVIKKLSISLLSSYLFLI